MQDTYIFDRRNAVLNRQPLRPPPLTIPVPVFGPPACSVAGLMGSGIAELTVPTSFGILDGVGPLGGVGALGGVAALGGVGARGGVAAHGGDGSLGGVGAFSGVVILVAPAGALGMPSSWQIRVHGRLTSRQ